MKLRYSARTDVGKKREINEDSYGPSDLPQEGVAGQLMVVCDGMGGHAAGEVASSLGVDTILSTYYAMDGADRAEALRIAFEQANQRIFEQGHGTMGTTGVAALLYNDTLYIANVGDSRAYRVHNGALEQVSRDHSYVSEQVQAGLLTPEQARTSLVRNIITRALGHQPEVKVDIFTVPVSEGDMVILSSDGMHGLVEDNEIEQAVTHLPPEKATAALINLANQRGGVDNITVIVAKVERMNGATVYDGTTHTLPAINASEAPTDRVPAAPLPAETPTIPPVPSRAHTPTDKFPTILGQQAVQRVDQPPPAPAPSAPAHAPTSPPPAASTPVGTPAARPAPVERPASGMGIALAALLLLVLVGVGSWIWFNGFQNTVAPAITATPPANTTAQPSSTAAATQTSAPSATTAPTTQPSARPTTQPTSQATSATTGGASSATSAATSASISATARSTSSASTTRTSQAQAPAQNISQPASNGTTVIPQRVVATTRLPARTATRTVSPTVAASVIPSESASIPTATIEPPSPTVAQNNDLPSEAENLLRTAIAAATSASDIPIPIPTIGQ